MPVDLSKPDEPSNGDRQSVTGGDLEGLRRHIRESVGDYCDATTRRSLAISGNELFGLDSRATELTIEAELQRLGAFDEVSGLKEMHDLLRRFTDRTKKLGTKERLDLLQLACGPKPGYTRGLNPDVAERYLAEFCRSNAVRVKVGVFKWVVP